MKGLENQTIYKLVYNDDLLPQDLRINLNTVNTLVEDALKEMFKSTRLSFRMMSSNLIVIIVSEASKPQNEAAQLQVTSRVSDPSGQPLEGVLVIEKGTGNGTTTGADGQFSIVVAGPSSILVFSYVGYERQEIAVGTATNISVQ